ncbi:hypothetical protein [Ruthenibacterium lactatiformans]|uniref:hypothetical protein n=1 Tax=Ruthenibacterium lactatiformans TaxID=1550024 RepID=UPI0039A23411
MDEYKSAPEVVHHGALLGACYMVDLLQDTEQPAKLRRCCGAVYDRAYGRPLLPGRCWTRRRCRALLPMA